MHSLLLSFSLPIFIPFQQSLSQVQFWISHLISNYLSPIESAPTLPPYFTPQAGKMLIIYLKTIQAPKWSDSRVGEGESK